MKRIWVIALIVSSIGLTTQCPAAESVWKIEAPSLSPATELSRHFSATISKEGMPRTKLEGEVPLTTLKHWFVSGNKLALLGASGNADAVIVFDLARRQKIDWFYCYQPEQVTDKWIIYIEWYPNHTSERVTDVVLLYDLTRTPLQNRLTDQAPLAIPAPESARPTRVGIPIYPEFNVRQQIYTNVAEDQANVRLILGGPGFTAMSPNRVVFVSAAQPGGDARSMNDQIVVVDMSNGISQPKIAAIPIPVQSLAKPPERPNFVRVTAIESVAPDKLRLSVPRQQYGVDSILVDVPKM